MLSRKKMRAQGAMLIGSNCRSAAGTMKGQGATEYLVLLAVVLIIALVSLALLGFFPGLAGDARMTQSAAYWKSEARPFAIIEHSIDSAGAGIFVLQNIDAGGTYTISNLSVASATGSGSNVTPATFASGETKQVQFTITSPGASGSSYELDVNITYTSPYGVVNREYGSKKVIGKYS